MTVKLSSLRADLTREAEGDWVDYPDWPGVALHVRSLQTPAYRIARDQAAQRAARKHRGKPIPPDEVARTAGTLYADHILLGWRGLDEDYSPERAREVLTDPAYREVVGAVEWCAARVGETDAEFVEDAAGNSQRASATS